MKKLVALILAVTAYGQTVAISRGTPDVAVTSLYYYSGTNLTYICKTPPQHNPQSYGWAITPAAYQGTLTSIAVSSNTGTVTTVGAHGLTAGNLVTVSGSTTTALNGTYVIQTVGSTTTFTITTSGVGNATYSTAALVLSSTAPRTTDARWNIERFTYDGSNNLIADQSSTNGSGGIASTAYNQVCDNRAVSTGSTKIAFQ